LFIFARCQLQIGISVKINKPTNGEAIKAFYFQRRL
jgi:hypothetical protein